MNEEEFIAHIKHIAWVSFQIAAKQPYNKDINEDQLESLLDSVVWRKTHIDITEIKSHKNWIKKKLEQGWKFGPIKDFEKKEHPDLVPYDQLPDCE